MAAIGGSYSLQVSDYIGVITSIDLPFVTTSGLISDTITWGAGLQSAVDAFIGGQILKATIHLGAGLTGGLKSTPTNGDDAERTGLLTWRVAGSVNAYGTDFPSVLESVLADDLVTISSGEGAALVAYMNTVHNTTQNTDRYGNDLSTVIRAQRTFRKHRRALKRTG